jgi:hypothetical protein
MDFVMTEEEPRGTLQRLKQKANTQNVQDVKDPKSLNVHLTLDVGPFG